MAARVYVLGVRGSLPVQAAKEAENLVIQKMRCQDYVILCVEDTTDWKHATTRNVVTEVCGLLCGTPHRPLLLSM